MMIIIVVMCAIYNIWEYRLNLIQHSIQLVKDSFEIYFGEKRSDNPSTPFNPCQIAKIFSIAHVITSQKRSLQLLKPSTKSGSNRADVGCKQACLLSLMICRNSPLGVYKSLMHVLYTIMSLEHIPHVYCTTFSVCLKLMFRSDDFEAHHSELHMLQLAVCTSCLGDPYLH